MSIKITDKILSIPPYISTSWSRIAGLHMKGSVLAITLVDGDTLHIPNLNTETVHLIFQHHAVYLEKEYTEPVQVESQLKNLIEQGDSSIRFAFGSSMDGLGNILQHNTSQSDSPDLPLEVLHKVGAIAKIMGPSDEILLPKAEPGCNCFHCQISRALQPTAHSEMIEEQEVTEEELQFQEWTITQTGDKLFSVVSRLDEKEKYNVYLGEPVGCTCGKQGCDHILAVLKS